MLSNDVNAMASAIRPLDGTPPSSDGFLALLRAFFGNGGIARVGELESMFQERRRGDYTSLARLMATGRVFFFEWRDTQWVPMCQFDPRNLQVKPAFEQVCQELARTLSRWHTANWLTTPNLALNHRRPIDVLELDAQAVLSAAMAVQGTRCRPAA